MYRHKGVVDGGILNKLILMLQRVEWRISCGGVRRGVLVIGLHRIFSPLRYMMSRFPLPRISGQLRPSTAMKVVPVPVRQDNYAYLLIDEPSNKAAAIDPYDVGKVTATADTLGVEIVAAITTHHHFDHSGGNKVPFFHGAVYITHKPAA